MVLKTDPEKLLDEVEGALRERRRRCSSRRAMLEQYHTPWFKSASEEPLEGHNYNPENTSHDYVAHMLGQLVFENPTTSVKSRRGDSVGDAMTASYKHGLRQWIVDTRYRDVVEPLAVDYLFPTGFSAMITPTRNPTVYADESWDEEPEWPQIVRISPPDFFRDPLALSKREARFEGHRWLIDKDDLVERAKKDNADEDQEWGRWDLEAIESIEAGSGMDDYNESRRRAETLGMTDRESICCYTVWIPEYTEEGWPGPEEGFHGGEFTMASHATAGGIFLRDPKPFFGPRWGPYESTATYPVPDDPCDLAVLVASEGQVRDFNRHVKACSESAARYKRIILVGPSANQDAIDLIVDGEHDLVVRIDGLGSEVFPVEIGGTTDQMIQHLLIAKDRAERSLGMADTKKGIAKGDATATEAAIADTASQIRVDFVKQVWVRAQQRMLTTVAWYMWHSKAMRWPIGPEILEDLGDEAVERMTGLPMEMARQAVTEGLVTLNFKGGDGVIEPEGGEAARTGIRFDDLQIEIAPHSMERPSEANERAKGQMLLELLGIIPPAMMAAPYVFWDEALRLIGQRLGLEELEKLVDMEAFADFVGFQQQQQVLQGPGSQGFQGPARSQSGSERASPAQVQPAGSGTPWGGQNVRREAKRQKPLERGTQRALEAAV